MLKNSAWLILISATIQIWLCTYALKLNWAAWMPILFCFNGLFITISLIKQQPLKVELKFSSLISPWKLGLLLVCMLFSFQLARIIFDNTPVAIEHADMLPIINVMCSRFLNGNWQQIYSPIPEIWNGIQPIYQPAMWLPFVLPQIFHFDLRWITVGGVWVSVILNFWNITSLRNMSVWVVLTVLAILLWWLHTEERNNLFRLTEEGVVIAYYVMLAYAIVYRKPILLGFAVVVCLLSRYVIIAAIPAIVIWWITQKEWKILLYTGITIIIGSTLTLVFFGFTPFQQMFHIPATYVQHATNVWNGHPEYFTYTPGMAALFGKNNIGLQHQILLFASFGLPILFVLWLILFNQKFRFANVELAIVTLTITTFYCLIDVPYLYLFYTPAFWYLSISVLSLTTMENSPK